MLVARHSPRLGDVCRSFAQKLMRIQNHLVMLLVIATSLGGCDRSKTVDTTTSDQPRSMVDAKPQQPERKSKVVSVTDAASEKMKSFLNGDQKAYIRLSVKHDGPTGFMYDLKIDDAAPNATDLLDDTNGFLLVTDTKSSLYLDGATIDWETRPDGSAGFKFDNPNAIQQ
jgi:iron-sulfur cluster insertion protein